MVTQKHTMLVAALLLQTSGVFTTAVELTRRGNIDSDWTISPFVTCMRGKDPSFPSGNILQQDVIACHDASHSKDKRTTINMAPDSDVETYALQARQAPNLQTVQDPSCSQTTLPKNFMVVSDIRSGAHDWCQQMKGDLLTAGTAKLNPTLQDAVTKSANELHGKKAVMLSLVLTAYPPALKAFQTVQGIDTMAVDACTQALSTLATKDQGCTTEINWYNAGKAKGETSTGARPGQIDIANGGEEWFFLIADYLAPGTTT